MDYDILTERQSEIAIEIGGSEMVSFRKKDISKSGVRAFSHGLIKSASFVGDIDDEKLVHLAETAEGNEVPFAHELPGESSFQARLLNNESDALAALKRETEEVLDDLRSKHPNFVFSGKSAATRIKRSMKSSYGPQHSIEFDQYEQGFLYKHAGSANIIDGWFSGFGVGESELADSLERHRPFLEAFESDASIEPGVHPVLYLAPDGLLSKLGESLRRDLYESGSVLYSGKLGEQVLSRDFSVSDVSYAPEVGITDPFDGEGFVRDRFDLPLVDQGRLVNLISDLRIGHKFGVESTGNGVRRAESGVRLDFNNLVIQRGKQKTGDLAASLGDCICVLMSAGGGFTDDGVYSAPANLSFLVRNGEPVGRLPQLTLRSRIQDMFGGKLVAVASDGQTRLSANPSVFIDMDVIVN